VAECLQLFKELAVLVQEQGALIDNIELNVNQTKDYVEKATKNLQKAREHHRCTRKWMIWTIVIGIILVVVTLAIVLAVVLN
jgi:t-SNARE complex subunit (syntaxin)